MVEPTSAERGREVRQRLVRAATELIPERGWTGVSTRLLAERAQVAPGLVHYHFSSVRALLVEAATATLRGSLDELGPLLEQARTPDDALHLMLGSLEAYSGRDPTSLLVIEVYLAATRDDELRRVVDAILTELRRQLGQWLDGHGVDRPEETAAVLVAAVDGAMLHRSVRPDLTAADIAPVLRGILAPAATGHHGEREVGKNP